jgi:hypothetical protein
MRKLVNLYITVRRDDSETVVFRLDAPAVSVAKRLIECGNVTAVAYTNEDGVVVKLSKE